MSEVTRLSIAARVEWWLNVAEPIHRLGLCISAKLTYHPREPTVQLFILVSSSPLKFEEAERRAVLSIFSGPGCVWQTLVARSHLSARSVELWARCLAHCEGTKPSVYSSVSSRLWEKKKKRE